MFTLDPRLATDTLQVTDLALCQVRLMNDAQYPWLVLVPRREGIREIFELDSSDRTALLDESCRAAQIMVALFAPVKLNVAALGNVVPQLHVHHIARFEHDMAWPAPVWGKMPHLPYAQADLDEMLTRLRAAFDAG